jgi:hypothetical protein
LEDADQRDGFAFEKPDELRASVQALAERLAAQVS